MTYDGRDPDVSFVIPASNEYRWSDLLATLVSTDPRPMADLLGVAFDAVRREVVVPGQVGRNSDRLDLRLLQDGQDAAAIEVKLHSDLGPQQLARYQTALPSAGVYPVLHLERLPVNLRGAAPGEPLTWESVLGANARSENPRVATTARAGLAHLVSLVPVVGAGTVWNDVLDRPASSWRCAHASRGSRVRWTCGATWSRTWLRPRVAATGRQGCGPVAAPKATSSPPRCRRA